MFQFAAELKGDKGRQMLVMVLEEEDLFKLGNGQMLVVKPPPLHEEGGIDCTTIEQCGIYFTRQSREVFLDEMRRAGMFHGAVLVDNRAQPSQFAKPYELGIKARRDGESLMPMDPELTCPYPSGPWRDYWILGWNAEDQRRMNEAFQKRVQ